MVIRPLEPMEFVPTVATANWTNRVNDGLQTPF